MVGTKRRRDADSALRQLVIEAWKITKAVDIKVIPSVGTLIPYKLEITDKHVLTEDELKTQEYDKLAFKWCVLFPSTTVLTDIR